MHGRRRHDPPLAESAPPRPIGRFALGAAFGVAALACGYLASLELRAGAAAQAIAAAGSPSITEDRRDRALADAETALSSQLRSGRMAELAATQELLKPSADLDRAEADTREALRRSPARGNAWVRLAYLDTARDGRLDESGRAAFARSYRVEPYGPRDLRRWRLEFALTRWSLIDPDTQAAVLEEARAAAAGGADWYEESTWMWRLAERLPPEPAQALLAAISPDE